MKDDHIVEICEQVISLYKFKREIALLLPGNPFGRELHAIDRLVQDRAGLVLLMRDLGVQPPRTGDGWTVRNYDQYPGQIIDCLRDHLKMGPDVGESHDRPYRERRDFEETSQYATEMAEHWMKLADERRRAGK